MAVFILIILAIAALVGFFGMLALLFKEGRKRRISQKALRHNSNTITRIIINTDGKVTIITDESNPC